MRVLAVFVIVGCSSKPPDSAVDPAKARIAKLAVDKLAHEGVPRWMVTHPSVAFPPNARALAEDDPDLQRDPWGNEFRLLCGDQAPPGVKGCGVFSLGPDGHEATLDDILSWKPLP